MTKFLLFAVFSTLAIQTAFSQDLFTDSLGKARDNALRLLYREDSIKVAKEYAEKEKWAKVYAIAIYPLLKGGKNSGVIPVKDPTFIPDPNMDYKILFELSSNNPDSAINDINAGLDEVARIINLHYASGIPAKRIIPVIVVHGGALNVLKNNIAFQKKYKIDNPNLLLIKDMEHLGAQFIACGQAMSIRDVKKEDLQPEIKISLSAQTVISSYQLKGFILHPIED